MPGECVRVEGSGRLDAEAMVEARLRALDGAGVSHDPATGEVMSDRARILNEAKCLIDGERQDDYGPPGDSFGRIAEFWTTYLVGIGALQDSDPGLDGSDVAIMMALLKVSRMCESPEKRDSYVDLVGYGALAGELSGADE